jgi:hypothetical protein
MDRFDLNFLNDYSDDALLGELQRVAGLVTDKTLTQRAFKEGSGRVHPQTRGKTILENLQTLCEPCNLGKGRSCSRVV